ncbi:MAG: hypothetical protein HY264_01645, partial [Chloroflexi bacterium]|nr:hypothetical protein [Chloroflexota bacterium]
ELAARIALGEDIRPNHADPDQLVSAVLDARARAMLTPGDLAEIRRHLPFACSRL